MLFISINTVIKKKSKNNYVNYINNLYNYSLLNILYLSKSILNMYIFFYTSLKKNISFLIINNNFNLNILIETISNITKSNYINKWIHGFITNWITIKKNILLLYWLIYIYKIYKIKNLKFPYIIQMKLFNIFIKLKNKLFGCINMKSLPKYIILINNGLNKSILNELFINKHLCICILKNKMYTKYCYLSLYCNSTLVSNKLLLYLFILSWVQKIIF